MTGRAIARFLRNLANTIENMSAEELEKLPERLRALRPLPGGLQTKHRSSTPQAKLDGTQSQRIIADLRAAPSREDGYDLLDRITPTRSELVSLARVAKVNITKADDVARIKEKLVEFVIGSRLNFLAIRGEE